MVTKFPRMPGGSDTIQQWRQVSAHEAQQLDSRIEVSEWKSSLKFGLWSKDVFKLDPSEDSRIWASATWSESNGRIEYFLCPWDSYGAFLLNEDAQITSEYAMKLLNAIKFDSFISHCYCFGIEDGYENALPMVWSLFLIDATLSPMLFFWHSSCWRSIDFYRRRRISKLLGHNHDVDSPSWFIGKLRWPLEPGSISFQTSLVK